MTNLVWNRCQADSLSCLTIDSLVLTIDDNKDYLQKCENNNSKLLASVRHPFDTVDTRWTLSEG